MPREPQSYEEYAGYFTREMRQRAIDSGCRTIAEYAEWLDRHYGRDQNKPLAPPPYVRR